MHETVIAKEIIDKAKEHGEVKSILLEIGELADIPPDHLVETLNNMTDWNVVVKEKKSRVKCSCGYEGPAKIIEKRHELTLFVCPVCSTIPKVIEGKDIILKEVEVK